MKKYIFIVSILVFTACKQEKKELSEAIEPITLPYFNTADFTPTWGNPSHKIPSFSFTDQNGVTITNDTYKGKIYIADFFFTICPGICPTLTKNMNVLQEAYKNDDDIMLLSHSVMPWVDTVEKLKEYSVEKGVDADKWHLVTGEQEALYNIAREGYFADEEFTKTQDVDQFIHTENFILVDQEGYIRGVYNGTVPIDVNRLRRHIALLQQEYKG